MSFVQLGISHFERWGAIERARNERAVFYAGFTWFETWPVSRRLRWPFGRHGASVFDGWVCTREQMINGALKETNKITEESKNEVERKWIKIESGKWVEIPRIVRLALGWKNYTNQRIGFAPSGEVLP